MGCRVPSHIDAQGRPRLLPAALVDAPGGLHHLLHRLVLTQTELVDHGGAVLDHAHLWRKHAPAQTNKSLQVVFVRLMHLTKYSVELCGAKIHRSVSILESWRSWVFGSRPETGSEVNETALMVTL